MTLSCDFSCSTLCTVRARLRSRARKRTLLTHPWAGVEHLPDRDSTGLAVGSPKRGEGSPRTCRLSRQHRCRERSTSMRSIFFVPREQVQ